MAQATSTRVRRAVAALFVLAAGAALPLVLLGWGRVGAPVAETEPADAGGARSEEFIPSEGGRWAVTLMREDGDRLLAAFFDTLAAGPGKEAPGGASAGGPPVVVTLYAEGMSRVRVRSRAGSPEASVRQAAGRIAALGPRAPDPAELRVRIDVIREAWLLPPDRRIAFARGGLAEPAGAALAKGGAQFCFLPGELADYEAGTHETILHVLCRRAGVDPGSWRSPEVRVWRLQAVGFVNSAPGSRYALESPRGLTPVGEFSVAQVLRACRLAGDYLLRGQQDTGAFLVYRDVATGLRGGCTTVTEHVAAAGALAVLCELRPKEAYPLSCYRSLSFAMAATDTDASNPQMAFTRRQEVCNVAWELETSAHVLEALCRYRRVSGLSEPDAWIRALAEFLLFMQRDDGVFELAYDARTGARTTPQKGAGRLGPQAKAALALTLAHRELGGPKYLSAVRKALAALEEGTGLRTAAASVEEVRWLAAALREAHAFLPEEGYSEWVGELAAERRRAQIGPADAPAEDFVGATLATFPPTAQDTADDLVVFASACIMDGPDRRENLQAARRAAAWLGRLQFLPENSYYLSEPDVALGGFREVIGSNVVRVQTLETALRGLVMLARIEIREAQRDDRESQDR